MLKKRIKTYRENFKPLTKYMKDIFAGKVQKVTMSQRVEKSPSVIVTSQYGHTANMERLMRAQPFSDQEQMRSMAAQRTLELNPRHPIVVELNKLVVDAPSEESTKDLAYLLYDSALMTSGFMQDDVESFADRMYRIMASSLNIQSLELLEEIEDDDEEEEEEEKNEGLADNSHKDEGNDEF